MPIYKENKKKTLFTGDIKMDSCFQVSEMLYFWVEDWVYRPPQEEAYQIADHSDPSHKFNFVIESVWP